MGGKIVEFVQTGTRSMLGSAMRDTNFMYSISFRHEFTFIYSGLLSIRIKLFSHIETNKYENCKSNN